MGIANDFIIILKKLMETTRQADILRDVFVDRFHQQVNDILLEEQKYANAYFRSEYRELRLIVNVEELKAFRAEFSTEDIDTSENLYVKLCFILLKEYFQLKVRLFERLFQFIQERNPTNLQADIDSFVDFIRDSHQLIDKNLPKSKEKCREAALFMLDVLSIDRIKFHQLPLITSKDPLNPLQTSEEGLLDHAILFFIIDWQMTDCPRGTFHSSNRFNDSIENFMRNIHERRIKTQSEICFCEYLFQLIVDEIFQHNRTKLLVKCVKACRVHSGTISHESAFGRRLLDYYRGAPLVNRGQVPFFHLIRLLERLTIDSTLSPESNPSLYSALQTSHWKDKILKSPFEYGDGMSAMMADYPVDQHVGLYKFWFFQCCWLPEDDPLFDLDDKIDDSVVVLDRNHKSPHLMLSPDRLVPSSASYQSNIRSSHSVRRGVVFYEVVLLTDGPMRVGWATGKAKLSAGKTSVGDDASSIGFDRASSCIWHGGRMFRIFHLDTARSDHFDHLNIVGCLIDFKRQTFTFSFNGRIIEETDPPLEQIRFVPKSPYYAALSVQRGQICYCNFGQQDFWSAPRHIEYSSFNEAINSTQSAEIDSDDEKKALILRNIQNSAINLYSKTEMGNFEVKTVNYQEETLKIEQKTAAVEGNNVMCSSCAKLVKPNQCIKFACCVKLCWCVECICSKSIKACPECV